MSRKKSHAETNEKAVLRRCKASAKPTETPTPTDVPQATATPVPTDTMLPDLIP